MKKICIDRSTCASGGVHHTNSCRDCGTCAGGEVHRARSCQNMDGNVTSAPGVACVALAPAVYAAPASVAEHDAPASVMVGRQRWWSSTTRQRQPYSCSAGRVHATTSGVEYRVVPTPAWCATTAPAAEYISQGAAQVQVEECIFERVPRFRCHHHPYAQRQRQWWSCSAFSPNSSITTV